MRAGAPGRCSSASESGANASSFRPYPMQLSTGAEPLFEVTYGVMPRSDPVDSSARMSSVTEDLELSEPPQGVLAEFAGD